MNLMGNGFLGVGFGGIVVVYATAMPTIAVADGPAKTMQCWTDDRGARACGDHVPPKYAKAERDVVDNHGVVVKVLPRQRTAAEQADYDRQQETKKQADAAVRQQAAYDGFLLQAYQSAAEIERTRDDRLSAIDGRLALIDKSRISIDATLADINTRVKAAGTSVPADLLKQQRSFQDARLENAGAMTRLQDERNQTADQFKRDIARYRSLRGLPPQP